MSGLAVAFEAIFLAYLITVPTKLFTLSSINFQIVETMTMKNRSSLSLPYAVAYCRHVAGLAVISLSKGI